MNRRELLGAAIAGASMAIAAQDAFAEEHEHAHAGHPGLSEAARKCVSSGDACLSHCLTLLAAGDTSMGACAKSVYQMSAVCAAIAPLAAMNSEHLGELAKVAYATCTDCEKECRKHEAEHAVCK